MVEWLTAQLSQRDAPRAIGGRRFKHLDHPEILTIPESGYIKAALLEALD